MALDEPKDNDKTFEFDSLKFVVEENLLGATGGIEIKYVNHAFGGGFQIESKEPLGGKSGGNSCGPCSC